MSSRKYSVLGGLPYTDPGVRERSLAVRDGVFDQADIARLADALPERTVLVPVPSRTGSPTWSFKMARLLAAQARALGKQAYVRPLVAGAQRESLHEAKHSGRSTAGILLGFHFVHPVHDARELDNLRHLGCRVVVVDNVVDTGRTFDEMKAVVGDADICAIAYTENH